LIESFSAFDFSRHLSFSYFEPEAHIDLILLSKLISRCIPTYTHDERKVMQSRIVMYFKIFSIELIVKVHLMLKRKPYGEFTAGQLSSIGND
jgi:hypothetical protein